MIVLALLIALPRPGGKLAAARALTLLAVLAVLITPALLIGGSSYLHGIDITTLERALGTDAPVTVLVHFWSWTGVIVVAAVCGVVIGWVSRAGRMQAWRLTLLTAAALLVPAEQASLYTTASLNKHGAMGAWFAAIAAGYAVDRLIAAAPEGTARTVTSAACVVALSFPVTLGATQSWMFATSWPHPPPSSRSCGRWPTAAAGGCWSRTRRWPSTTCPSGSQWQRWSSTRNIVLPSGAPTGGPSAKAGVVGDGNAGTYAMYIAEGYFSLVALNFTDTKPLDQSIAADLRRNHRYHIIDVIPYGPAPGTYVIWRYEPRS